MEATPREVDVYVLPETEAAPFDDYLDELKDPIGRKAIDRRINQVRRGLIGEYREVGTGVIELKIDTGPGYRVYCADDGKSVLLLCAGSKRTQAADIARANAYWTEHKKQNAKEKL